MRMTRTVVVLALGLVVAGAMPPAAADVTVTVQISGTIEEIMPILQMLQQSGFEKAAKEQLEGLKLEISSTAPAPGAEATAPAETVPAPPPQQPSLSAPTVSAAPAKPGDAVLITVSVTNPDGRIDTVAAHAAGAGTWAFDLYDNGTQGDAVAGDGVWSYLYTVPADAADGEIHFEIIAFDANASPVTVKNEAGEDTPLTAQAVVTVQKPQA